MSIILCLYQIQNKLYHVLYGMLVSRSVQDNGVTETEKKVDKTREFSRIYNLCLYVAVEASRGYSCTTSIAKVTLSICWFDSVTIMHTYAVHIHEWSQCYLLFEGVIVLD